MAKRWRGNAGKGGKGTTKREGRKLLVKPVKSVISEMNVEQKSRFVADGGGAIAKRGCTNSLVWKNTRESSPERTERRLKRG